MHEPMSEIKKSERPIDGIIKGERNEEELRKSKGEAERLSVQEERSISDRSPKVLNKMSKFLAILFFRHCGSKPRSLIENKVGENQIILFFSYHGKG